MRRRHGMGILLATVVATVAPWAEAQSAQPEPKRKPDLGDAAEGSYAGDVISDSKGSSHDGVTLTVTRIGVNRVRITSDYPRLPVVEVGLTKAMGKIVQARGDTAYVYDSATRRLDVSFHNEVSWSGTRQ
jgi:hypothetical protein